MDDFLWRALLAGIGVAINAGAMGAFLVWRRMAFFGDTLSHAALLGVALGLFLGIDLNLAAMLLCCLVAAGFAWLQRNRRLSSDTVLGVIAHSSLAAGIIAVSLLAPRRSSLESYLFGDLLAVGPAQLELIYGLGFGVALLGAICWRSWLAIAVDEEMAQVEGVNVERMKFLQMLVIACLTAVAMNVVGVLLITALLVIPAATARSFARSPEQMIGLGAVFGCGAVMLGLWISWLADTPAGPSIVLAAALFFLAAQAVAIRS